ncbi:DUF4832 domain-containing protein [Kineosporia sp. J2-2]|uniref:DUF4832 domain-containing protein n=1 Tax=Kineosporia corallincola TaxID=2835133 RepID=A0ABS5T9D7_9ACTN|nr:DUF4832 domain-containing protein [Kineosporia corallincola]MBT0767690.1 DUF4832 domain-containing protein [Kineosporia corallincola]
MRYTKRVLAGAVAGLVLCGGLAVSASAGEPTTVSYTASEAVIANPERGFYHHTETHYRADGSGYTPLDAETLAGYREEGVTQILRVFYLEKFAADDTLDEAYLKLVRADLETARAAGVSVIVRFAYAQGGDYPYTAPYGDAPLDTVLAHIALLKPVFHDYADVIALVQQGFIGLWGEGYYTDHFAADPSDPGTLTQADWDRRNAVLKALLAAVPDERMVAVRTMFAKQQYLDSDAALTAGQAYDGSDAARIGHHNDCFLASADDYGTFLSDPITLDQEYLEADSAYLPVGGETCGVNAPRSEWASASAEMARYHYSYLNRDYHADVLNSWGEDGLDETAKELGYRFVMTSSDVDGATVSLGVRNDGWAAPYNPRTARLVLKDGENSYTVGFDADADVRTWAAGESVALTATVHDVPAGTYDVYLAIPADGEAADNPLFAIRTANEGTWDAESGLNDLGQTVTVSQ